VTRTGTTALTLSDEIRQRFDEFSRSQKDVGQYIVDHLEEAAFHTAEELARRANTSSSTVVRFAQALGFEGFPELQAAARDEYRRAREGGNGGADVAGAPLFPIDQTEFEAALAADHANLAETARKVDRDEVSAAVDLISHAERIVLCGTDQMAFFASYLRHLLMLLDLRAEVVASPSQENLAKLGRVHDKMGERLANNAELIFQDCFIPDENVVGRVGEGFNVLAEFFPQSNAYAGASVLGVAGALHQKAIDWARARIQGGKPLIEHDGIRAQLAEMRMLIDASRSYIHRACWLADHQEHGWDRTLGALPKAMAAQAAWQIATWTMEIHGGHGYMKELGVEKLVRDAAAFLHSDGVNRTLFLKAANFMFRD